MSRAVLAKFASITVRWHAGSVSVSPPATRRARQRQATVAEIKALARAQLAGGGTGAVNLRAIAREMGTASSALFRYFPSQADLISELLADAYAAVAGAGAAAARTITTALGVYAAAVQAGAADPDRSAIPAGIQTGPLWASVLAGQAHDYEPRLAGIILTAWASVLGYLSAEIFGSLTALVADTGLLYRAHIRAVMTGMGYDPGLAGAATA